MVAVKNGPNGCKNCPAGQAGVATPPEGHWRYHVLRVILRLDSPRVRQVASTSIPWPQERYAQLLQLCPTLCDPMDCSPPGSSVPGILQARILEWIAMPSSRGSSRPRDQTCISCIAGGFFTDESPEKPREKPCTTLTKQHPWRQGQPTTSFSPASPCCYS